MSSLTDQEPVTWMSALAGVLRLCFRSPEGLQVSGPESMCPGVKASDTRCLLWVVLSPDLSYVSVL